MPTITIPTCTGFDVYRFPKTGSSPSNPPNSPAPSLLLTKSGMSDSHGVASTGTHLWVMDRYANVAEIIELRSGDWVNTVSLSGGVSTDPAPDLVDRSPAGDRLFVAPPGAVPLSGDPHNATGSAPGLGIIEVNQGGRGGRLAAVVPLTTPLQQPNQAPDAHGLRVRLRRGRW